MNIPDMFTDVDSGHEYMANYDVYETNLLRLENDATFSDPETLSAVVEKITNGPPKKMIYANFWLESGELDIRPGDEDATAQLEKLSALKGKSERI